MSSMPMPKRTTIALALGSSFAEPRSCLERILSRLWTEILGLEQVGVHDNFFELGGDSLSATQMISRLRSAFKVDLPLHDFFEEPTVAGLAAKFNVVTEITQRPAARSASEDHL